MDTQTTVLLLVGAYFTVGALIAVPLGFIGMAFSGRLDPMAFALFFAWPLYVIARVPALSLLVIGGAAIASMVGLAWAVMCVVF